MAACKIVWADPSLRYTHSHVTGTLSNQQTKQTTFLSSWQFCKCWLKVDTLGAADYILTILQMLDKTLTIMQIMTCWQPCTYWLHADTQTLPTKFPNPIADTKDMSSYLATSCWIVKGWTPDGLELNQTLTTEISFHCNDQVSISQHSGPGIIVYKSCATHWVLITCNMLCATWYEETAQQLRLTELKSQFILALSYLLKPLTNEGEEETTVPGEKNLATSLKKCHILPVTQVKADKYFGFDNNAEVPSCFQSQ